MNGMRDMENLPWIAISESERKRRRDAVDYARASLALEGFRLSEVDEVDAQAFVDGDLTLNELITRAALRQKSVGIQMIKDD